MKFKVIRRVALTKQYEFTEIHAEAKNFNQAKVALENIEDLSDYARELEFLQPVHRRSNKG